MRGEHHRRVARVHAGFFDVLKEAADDDRLAVGDAVDIDLDRVLQELIDEDGLLLGVFDRCERDGEVTLAQVRDATGSSRKVVQALLERMDADGITRRTGDARILRRGAAT